MEDTAPPGEQPSVAARFGPAFRRLLDSMAPAVRALVDGSNSVIFDHVLHDNETCDSCLRAFAGLECSGSESSAPSTFSKRANAPEATGSSGAPGVSSGSFTDFATTT